MARRKIPATARRVSLHWKKGKWGYLLIQPEKGAKRIYESLNLHLTGDKVQDTIIKAEAERVRSQREAEVKAQTFQELPSLKRKRIVLSYWEEFAESRITTKETHHSAQKHFRDFIGSKAVRFSDVSDALTEQFCKYLANKVSVLSVKTYAMAWKSMLNDAYRKGYIARPINLPTIKAHTHQVDFLTIEELQTLARTPCRNEEVKTMFLFSAFTGLRLSDCEQLHSENFVEKGGELFIKKVIQKTGREEFFPLAPQAQELIRGRIGKIFSVPKRVSIGLIIRQWGKNALGKDIHFHMARHTFATLAISSGIDLYAVSKLLGHSSVKQSEHYAKLLDSRKADAVKMLPSLK